MEEKEYNFELFSAGENTRPIQRNNRNSTAYLKKRKKQRKRQGLFLVSVVVILLLLIALLVAVLKSCREDSTLIGKWSIDGITVYEFSSDGKGAMILPSETYGFTYTLKENKISIDFESEFATDKNYTYEIKDSKLTLKGEGKYGGTYEMTRIKQAK